MKASIKRIIKRLVFGNKCDSESYVKYLRSNGCEIGENVYFYSPRTTTIDSVRMDWIKIGSYTKITQGVTILAHDYSPSVMIHTHNRVILGGGQYTSIGENCFIGVNSIIMPGCKIGNNCIVGAGSVVTKDIPDNSVCGGNPAKVLMSIDEFYEKRQEAYLEDAKRNVNHFIEKRGRLPKESELKGFAFLFLEKNDNVFNLYYTDYLAHDNNRVDVKAAFCSTPQLFNSYDDFISFCVEDRRDK